MRLHRLRLQAFGPFAGTEQIDFDTLAAGGLHLIHGPTGAGKTSILDAICFALFAAVPGGRMQGRTTVRSDHAPVSTRPEVELEFSVGDRRLRVQRSPEHQVPKRRGEGLRTQRASVQLAELHAGRWNAVSTRHDEVAQVVGELLGMGLAQFAQVVLLPQGEFAAFLRATANDRARLLERLFDISDFAAVEQWLVEHRKAVEAQVQRADAARAALLARVRDTLGGIPTEAGGADSDREQPELDAEVRAEVLDQLASDLSGRLTAALTAADAADGDAERLRARLADERALAALQSHAADARATLDRLAAGAAQLAETRERLDRATRAEVCRSALDAAARRERAAAAAAVDVDGARGALAATSRWSVPESHGVSGLTANALHPLHERATAGTAALAGQAELHRQSRSVQRELREAIAAEQVARTHAESAAALARSGAERLTQLATRRTGLLPESVTHPQWQALRSEVAAADKAADSFASDLAEWRRLTGEHRTARRDWAAAERGVLQLRTARLAGIAAELADELADGQPCPVCGSCDHPQTAQSAPDRVSPEQLDAAEAELASSASRAEHAGARRSTAAGRAHTTGQVLLEALGVLSATPPAEPEIAETIAAARQSVVSALCSAGTLHDIVAQLTAPDAEVTEAGLTAVAQLRGALDRAADQVAVHEHRAADAVRRVRALDDELSATRAEHADAEQAAAAAAEAARAAKARVTSLRAQQAATDARLAELVRDHDAVCGCAADTEATAIHAACIEQLDALLAAVAAAHVAGKEKVAARRAADQQLAEQGFTDDRSATAAMLSTDARTRFATMVERAREERLKAEGVLEQPDVAAAAAAAPAEVERIATESTEAERAARHTRDTVGELRRALQTMQRIAAELRSHDAQTAPVRAELAVATSLAAAVTGAGDNVMRMRLTAYVLAARLETVTALANERLAVMTAGRYQLEHTDARAGRGSKSGLGLRVRDAWTDTTRDTATLSGGESFIASLALALGLGDAVLQAAGGRHLETLLVDEGFGSLDEDSLEHVLDVLDELRAGGRSVGIVSHVAELRTRIPTQLRVHKTARGSTLEVCTATEVA
ncbi:AAA family ATPase [Flexivirga caeni]|nr:SMC family ATPase [Flexivirga caeni]